MKLTKGKLSKIHAKKKQTMRKFKVKGKRSVKKKTFRKKRPLNLNHKTLKNIPIVEFKSGLIKGGVKDDNDGDIEMQNLSTQPTSKDPEPAAEPVPEPAAEPVPATVQDNLDENKNGETMQQEPAAEPVPATVQDNNLEMDQGEKDDSEQVLEQMEQEREKEKEQEENERKREAESSVKETAQPVESYLRDNEKLFDQEYKTEENDKSEDLNEISKLFEGYVTKLVSKAMTNTNTNATANVNSGIQNPVDAVRESVETLSSIQK
jgi:molecular chaperone DnaK (HSP70)